VISPAAHSGSPSGQPSTHRTLELNCLVLGHDLRNAFSVEISSTKNVSALQEAIRKKKEHGFKGVDADTLVLWKVSIPADGLAKEDPRILDLDEDQSLSPLEELSEVFSVSLPRKHIHIVVRAPPVGEWAFVALVYVNSNSIITACIRRRFVGFSGFVTMPSLHNGNHRPSD
jgi:hypothetical protein